MSDICIHDPYEVLPKSQCVICNGNIRADRDHDSKLARRRSKAPAPRRGTKTPEPPSSAEPREG
jgi:hypothetical protein